ncbi:MAG: hypothetical protein FP816_02190 [Desulfobacteraceae bacterium]|nr:hypothetical protein [Desulfobacteraceae bacterium]MBU4002245.1 hypothetical protein [Pseudomonadota bacterium]MBU4052919.1 hypothetical protein [Pseudomonadota bacterium]
MLSFVKKYLSLALTLGLGLLLQGIFICADQKNTPNKAAVEFYKAYYGLNEKNMEENLCESLNSKGFADHYVHGMVLSASARGYDPSYLKTSLFHIRTELLNSTEKTAVIRLTAKQRKSINPIFEYVGKIFFLLDESEVDQTIHLIKEKEQWKVCGGSMALS